jgi:hypothetical protein
MDMKLYMLELERGKYIELLWLYALDETDAMEQVRAWAKKYNRTIPHNAKLSNKATGFQLNTTTLPGTIPTRYL